MAFLLELDGNARKAEWAALSSSQASSAPRAAAQDAAPRGLAGPGDQEDLTSCPQQIPAGSILGLRGCSALRSRHSGWGSPPGMAKHVIALHQTCAEPSRH